MAINPQADPNKPAVYTAENAWSRMTPEASAELTTRQARKLSKQILNHPALDEIPGVAEARKSLLAKVSVRTGKLDKIAPGTRAATNGLGMTLYSKSHPITPGIVTHELAHKILAHTEGDPGHGPGFADLHRKVVQAGMGNVASVRLAAYYKQTGAI